MSTKSTIERKAFPLLLLACGQAVKGIAKAKSATAALAIPTTTLDTLAAQIEEVERLTHTAAAGKTDAVTLPSHLAAAARVGAHLHLTALDRIKHSQEKAGIPVPRDTKKLITQVTELADELSDQLSLPLPGSGVKSVTITISPWVSTAEQEAEAEAQKAEQRDIEDEE